MNPSEIVMIETSFSDIESAKRCISILIQKRYAACCHLYNNVLTCYYWDGDLHEKNEVIVRIKSSIVRVQEVVETIEKLHEYIVPEIFILKGSLQGSQKYEEWVISQCKQE